MKPFADIRRRSSCCTGERGLQSIALAPDFATSGRLFLFYTGEESEPVIHVAEMAASGATAPTSSLRDVIAPIPHPGESNHYGGQLQFGPDGALYVSTGDGGGGNDVLHNAQDPRASWGRSSAIVPASSGLVSPAVWSLGLRNPFRFSFDRQTGDLWIGDVGQDEQEEVDFAASPGRGQGANFGWNCYEGSVKGPFDDPECAGSSPSDFVFPVFEYENPPDGCAAVIGGYVARGPGLGDVFGRYLYGDLCVGDVRSFSPAAPALTDRYEGVHIDSLNSFGEDSCGRLYAVSGDGPVYRLVGSDAATCAGVQPVSLATSFVNVRAASRKVKRNRRALISAFVSPCNGRAGRPSDALARPPQPRHPPLDRVCSARFRPRIGRRSTFRVTVRADQAFAGAISRKLTIRPVRRHRHR